MLRLIGHCLRYCLLVVVSSAALAQQYESESRIISDGEASAPADFDPDKALQEAAGNPYATAMILRELAGQAMRDGQTAQAVEYLQRALDAGGLSEFAARELQKELAVLLAEKADYRAVVDKLAPILRQDDDPAPELQLVLGGAYAQLGNFRQALPLIESALENTRKPPHDWYALAAAAASGLERHDRAVEYIETALRAAPRELAYWRQLVAIQTKQGDSLGALTAMDLAFRLGLLEGGDDRLAFAQLFFANQVPFEAASVLQAGIEAGLIPNSPANQEMLAGAWLAAKEHQLAIPALQDAAAATGKGSLYLQLGQLQFDRGAWDAASRALAQALRRGAGSNRAEAYLLLGVAQYQQQNFAAARDAFQSAAEFRATRTTAQQWVEYLDSGLAREAAVRMAAQRPSDSQELSRRFAGGRVSDSGAAGGPRSGPAFTPVGAQRPGSQDGRIPSWTGGLTEDDWPAGYSPGQRLVDPFADDQPLFEVTAQNLDQHRDVLSLGHRALLRRYPDYRMPVYPSRRSVAYPQAIYAATQDNRGRARLAGSDALEGARLGFPFPSPRSGVEIMWNHRVRYRGNAVEMQTRQALVLPSGTTSEQFRQTERVLYRYANLNDPLDLTQDNILLYYLTIFTARSGSDSFVALVHESANSLEKARAIWVMPKNLSKLFRIPPVGYDNPFPGSGGVAFVDMVDMYNGAFDRYDWKLLGKRDVLLPYNSYRLNDARRPNDALLTPKFMDPRDARYELHRVWLIEANERGGKKHRFGARRFYVDEDSWNVVLVENYDRSGELWRFQEGHLLPHYNALWANAAPVVTYDLKDGRYFINRLTNDDDWLTSQEGEMSQREFLPAAVRARYAR